MSWDPKLKQINVQFICGIHITFGNIIGWGRDLLCFVSSFVPFVFPKKLLCCQLSGVVWELLFLPLQVPTLSIRSGVMEVAAFLSLLKDTPSEELERMLDFGVLILWNGSHASLSFSVG